jgi:hypothetical protein
MPSPPTKVVHSKPLILIYFPFGTPFLKYPNCVNPVSPSICLEYPFAFPFWIAPSEILKNQFY